MDIITMEKLVVLVERIDCQPDLYVGDGSKQVLSKHMVANSELARRDMSVSC